MGIDKFVNQVFENAQENLPKNEPRQSIWECITYVEDQLDAYNQDNEPLDIGGQNIEYIADTVRRVESTRPMISRGMRFTRDKKQTSKVFRERTNKFKQYAKRQQTELISYL